MIAHAIAVVILAIPANPPAPPQPAAPAPAAANAAPAPATGAGVVATATPSNFLAVIQAAAPGSTVQLAPGSYPTLRFNIRKAAPGIVIEGASGGETILSQGIALGGCGGVSIRNVTVRMATGITGCERVTLEGMTFEGEPADFASPKFVGVSLRGTRDVTIRNSRFRYLRAAVTHLDNERLTIEGNDVQYIRYDGFQGGANTTGLTIRNNVLKNFFASNEAHHDAIQLWPGSKGLRDALVEGNFVEPGETGGRLQHYFFGGDGGGGFHNFIVRRNVSFGAAFWGIGISGPTTGAVYDNFVQPAAGVGSWIQFRQVGEELKNWGNVQAQGPKSTDPKQPNKAVKAAKSLTDRKALGAWLAAHGRTLPAD